MADSIYRVSWLETTMEDKRCGECKSPLDKVPVNKYKTKLFLTLDEAHKFQLALMEQNKDTVAYGFGRPVNSDIRLFKSNAISWEHTYSTEIPSESASLGQEGGDTNGDTNGDAIYVVGREEPVASVLEGSTGWGMKSESVTSLADTPFNPFDDFFNKRSRN